MEARRSFASIAFLFAVAAHAQPAARPIFDPFEVATIKPGFAIDEPLASLGTALKLPPWEEHRRTLIESHLPPVEY